MARRFTSKEQWLPFGIAAAVAGAGIATLAVAQTIPPTPSESLRPAGSLISQATYPAAAEGTVELFLLNPEGLIDGLILDNGIQVKFPPHMGNELSRAVQPGDRVSVTGTPGVPSELGQEVKAYSITNLASGQTIVEQPPSAPPRPSAYSNYGTLTLSGTAEYWLIGRRGEIKGIVLSSGDQVRFPPHIGDQVYSLATIGATVEVEGFGTTTEYGSVLEATSLSVDGQSIEMYTRPLPPRVF